MNYKEINNKTVSKASADFVSYFKDFKPEDKRPDAAALARMIDHTLLKPDALPEEIENLCAEALRSNFASVCVNSSYAGMCFNIIKDSSVKLCSVVGFPLGASAAEVKTGEADFALSEGAAELDMVINIGRLKSGDYKYVHDEIKSVTDAAHNRNAVCKVIIETCLLTDEEKIIASNIAMEAGSDYIKTSTGFSTGGANIRDVALMKFCTGGKIKVKASGGIRSAEDALNMITAGADRLGTSSGVKIIGGYNQKI